MLPHNHSAANFGQYTNAEFISYHNGVVQMANKFDIVALHIEPQVVALAAASTILASLFKVYKGSDITDSMVELDMRRDNAITGIRQNADSFLRHFDATKRHAAKLLLATIDTYGKSISRLNYFAETAAINSIISQTSTDASMVAAVAALGLADWLQELATANQLFHQAYIERNEELAGRPTTKMLAQRADTEAAFKELEKHIAANNIITPNPDYTLLQNSIDALSAQFNLTVKRRHGKKAASATGPLEQ